MKIISAIKAALFGAPIQSPAPAPQPTVIYVGGGAESSLVHADVFGRTYLDALQHGGARTSIPWKSLDEGFNTSEREEVARAARHAYNNIGKVALTVHQTSTYCGGVIPQSASGNDAWDNLADSLFEDWGKMADFLGRSGHGLEQIQQEVSELMDFDGDALVVLISDDGPPKVKVIEGWKIGDWNDKWKTTEGIKFDRYGRIVGYCVRDGETAEMIPAEEAFLCKEASGADRIRGFSPFRHGLNDARDVRDILGFEKRVVKTQAGPAGFLEATGPVEEGHGFATGENSTPEAIEALKEASAAERQLERWNIKPGEIPILPSGRKFVASQSNRPNPQFAEFLQELNGNFIEGLKTPSAFGLDKEMTGPAMRAVLGKAQRRFTRRQKVLGALAEWIRARVLAWYITKSDLPANPKWLKCSVIMPENLTIDAGRDAQQDREDEEAGLVTRQELAGKRGKDWQKTADQRAKEVAYAIERAMEISKRTKLPLDVVLSRFGFKMPPAAPPAAAGSDKPKDQPVKK